MPNLNLGKTEHEVTIRCIVKAIQDPEDTATVFISPP